MVASQPPDDSGEAPTGALSAPVVEPRPGQRWGFGAFLLVEAVLVLSTVFLAALLAPGPPNQPVGVLTLLLSTILPTVLAAGAALLVTVLRGNGPVVDLRLTVHWSDIRRGLRIGAAGIVLTCVAAYVWSRAVGANDATSAITSLLDGTRMPVTAALVMFAYMWLLGPVCEEIIFRGLLWGAIERQRWGRWATFGLSTVIFAVSHLEPIRTTLLLVIAVPIGWARLRTGRLPASVITHQMNNFLPALATLLVALGAMRT